MQSRNRPTVVCLCGSTCFMDAFHEANRRESLAGKIVLTVEVVAYNGNTDTQRINPRQKAMLIFPKVQLIRKDEVLVLNVNGYIWEENKV